MAPESEPAGRDLVGFKYLDRLLPMLERLHGIGCGRDRAGNRKLHYDQYCLLVLLALVFLTYWLLRRRRRRRA